MLKNRIVFLILLAVFFAGYILWGDYTVFFATVFLLILFLLCLAANVVFCSLIRVKSVSCDSVIRFGESGRVYIDFSGTPFLVAKTIRVSMTITNSFSKSKANQKIYISPDKNKKAEFIVESDICGNVAVELKWLRVVDVLGLSSFFKPINRRLEMTFLPQIFPIRQELTDFVRLDNDGVALSDNLAGEEITDLLHYREYRENDKIKKVNWKLSARTEELMVREFAQPIQRDALIILDSFTPNESASIKKTMLSAAFTIAALYSEYQLKITAAFVSKTNGIEEIEVPTDGRLFESEMSALLFADEDETAIEYPVEKIKRFARIYVITSRNVNELSFCGHEKILRIKNEESFKEALYSQSNLKDNYVEVLWQDIESGLKALLAEKGSENEEDR